MPHGERFSGFVRGGKVRIDQADRWKALLAHLEGKPIEVSLGRLRQNRSLKANRRLWGAAVYEPISDWSGHTKDEVHAFLKEMFCPLKPITLPNGEEVMVRSTKLLDNQEFSEYMLRCEAWGAQQGVEFPEHDHVGDL